MAQVLLDNALILGNLCLHYHTLYIATRCSAIAERPCCRVHYSFVQKWKSGTERHYFTDIIGLSPTTENLSNSMKKTQNKG